MSWKIKFTKDAYNDIEKLKRANLGKKAKHLIDVIKQNPYKKSPPYKKLVGNLNGYLSRRINLKHRLVYQVIDSAKTIKIVRMWSHYEV